VSGYYSLLAECGICSRMFGSNPERVPCFPCDHSKPPGLLNRLSPNGTKSPVCPECFADVNALRVKNHLPPHVAHPNAWDAAETL